MTRTRRYWDTRWWMPAVGVLLGAIIWAAFSIGGNPSDGAKSFGVVALLAAVFMVSPRSGTLAGIGGHGRDERWAMIDLRATAMAGFVVTVVLMSCWLYELSQGHNGSPYGQVMAIGGVAYIISVALLRRRS
jgi:cobalamin synthase